MKIFNRFIKNRPASQQQQQSTTPQKQPSKHAPATSTPTRLAPVPQASLFSPQKQQPVATSPAPVPSLYSLKKVFSPTPKKKTTTPATTPTSSKQQQQQYNFQDELAQKYFANTRTSMTPFQIQQGNKENLNSSPSNKGYDFCFDQSSVMLTSKNPFLPSPSAAFSPTKVQSPIKSPTPQKAPAFVSTPKSTGKKRMTVMSPLAAESKLSQSAPTQRVLSPSQSFSQNSRQYAVFQSTPQKKLNFDEMAPASTCTTPMQQTPSKITGKKRTRSDCQSMDFDSIGSPTVAPPTEYVLSPDVFAPKNTVTRQYCLQLCLVEARNLVNTGLGFKTCSDPYVTLQLDEIQRHVSEVKKQSLAPIWNEHFAFTVMIEEEKSHNRGSKNYETKRIKLGSNLAYANKQAQLLKISVYDHDVLFDHELMGSCVIELDELVHECDVNGGTSGSVDVWKKLTKQSDEVFGHIHLTLRLEAVGNNIFNL